MRIDLAFDELLPHPVEAVWAAITSADAISGWLMATSDFRAEVGARFRMRTRHLAPGGRAQTGNGNRNAQQVISHTASTGQRDGRDERASTR